VFVAAQFLSTTATMLVLCILLAATAAAGLARKDYSGHALFYVNGLNIDGDALQALYDRFDVWRAVNGGVVEVFGDRALLSHHLARSFLLPVSLSLSFPLPVYCLSL
jgi:hypothetical protein